MKKCKIKLVPPEHVLGAIYGKTAKELGFSGNRRDEVIAAAIYASFWNQEFGTRFRLPADYRESHPKEDAEGIDMILRDQNGRRRILQIKGIHIQRSINRRIQNRTKGAPQLLGKKTEKQVKRDSRELTRIMRGELKKIIQDYRGIILVIHVIADLATQTSLEIAIRNTQALVSDLRAKEVWFLRNIPVRVVYGKRKGANCYAYSLFKVSPNKHSYVFSFVF